jgi:hypothetical protein
MHTLKNRRWFDKGGRHGLPNRVADLSRILESADTGDLTALDLGAAEGDISIWLSDRFQHVTAVELMEKAYRALDDRVATIANVTPIHGDVRIWRPSHGYDCVFLLGVLHFFLPDSQKREALEAALSATKLGCFVRTGIREHKLRDGWDSDKVQKYSPLAMFEEAAGAAGFDLCVVDNAWRGRGETRLGDLIYFRRAVSTNPLPSTEAARAATSQAAMQ